MDSFLIFIDTYDETAIPAQDAAVSTEGEAVAVLHCTQDSIEKE